MTELSICRTFFSFCLTISLFPSLAFAKAGELTIQVAKSGDGRHLTFYKCADENPVQSCVMLGRRPYAQDELARAAQNAKVQLAGAVIGDAAIAALAVFGGWEVATAVAGTSEVAVVPVTGALLTHEMAFATTSANLLASAGRAVLAEKSISIFLSGSMGTLTVLFTKVLNPVAQNQRRGAFAQLVSSDAAILHVTQKSADALDEALEELH